ncbi:MAG: M48 family metallopeptidase, partial [Candidatus Omnitrophica bacterium]|nr:M48 family metallopeptidase [Candidatus Omnitrophota bacterium]
MKRIEKQTCSLQTKSGEFIYLLTRSSARRSIAISVDAKGVVSVYCPFFVKKDVVLDFVKQKADWILKRVNEAKINRDYLDSKKFADGQEFLFLGRKYKIRIERKDSKRVNVDFNGLMWHVKLPVSVEKSDEQDVIKKAFVTWYKSQAKEILGGRIFNYSRILGTAPAKITVRTLKRIWGNCAYHTQAIALNWQIILSPISVVDYIVVHELCHLIVPNHSKRFWKKVEKILPRYKREIKWLKDNHLD